MWFHNPCRCCFPFQRLFAPVGEEETSVLHAGCKGVFTRVTSKYQLTAKHTGKRKNPAKQVSSTSRLSLVSVLWQCLNSPPASRLPCVWDLRVVLSFMSRCARVGTESGTDSVSELQSQCCSASSPWLLLTARGGESPAAFPLWDQWG